MVKIPVGSGYTAIVDTDDAPLVTPYRWYVLVRPGRPTYVHTKIAGHTVYLHRLILGARKGQQVDHRDGDGLNNRRENLRFATPSQNLANMRRPVTNTSGFKGVTRQRGKWVAMLGVDHRMRYLGTFSTPQAAHQAYLTAAKATYGCFARSE